MYARGWVKRGGVVKLAGNGSVWRAEGACTGFDLRLFFLVTTPTGPQPRSGCVHCKDAYL